MSGRTIGTPGASTEAPLPAAKSNDISVITGVSTDRLGVAERDEGADVASPPGATSALSFTDAARLCGHDPLCAAGAESARCDYRVWDLLAN